MTTTNRPSLLIAEPADFANEARALLEQVATVELRACDREELGRAFDHYDAIWFRLAHRIDAELIGAGPRCRLLATPVTGLDHIDLAACGARGIEVVSLRGETVFLREVRATAELTIALALAVMRRIVPAAVHVEQGGWDRDQFRGHELYGKTAGIVGVGRLGSIVGEYLHALGMQVIGFDPRPDFPEGPIERVESLSRLLGRADLVSLHVRYDPSTHQLIGAGELAQMKPGAVLINTARGGVIDEVALLAALESGHLGGAGLDVLYGEPMVDATHPLVAAAARIDNLVIVPHIGGNTVESFAKTELFLAQKVAAMLRGPHG